MKHALIIEDNLDNQVLICKILEHAGYETTTAETGMLGYELTQELQPDFILLDINLPDINGIEVLEKIRQTKEVSATPVIAVTSNAMLGDEESLLAAGCDAYLEKPIDVENIIRQIEKVLGN